jgi:hypothetical protein
VAICVGHSTVERTRKRFIEGGIERALNEQPRSGAKRKLDGKQEVLPLIATARWDRALSPSPALSSTSSGPAALTARAAPHCASWPHAASRHTLTGSPRRSGPRPQLPLFLHRSLPLSLTRTVRVKRAWGGGCKSAAREERV